MQIIIFFAVFATVKGTVVKLSCNDIKVMVDAHNDVRLMVSKGLMAGQPTTSALTMLVWNDDLAVKAANWAANNKFTNNPNKTLGANGNATTGENIYFIATEDDYLDLRMVVNAWAAESAYFDMSDNNTKNYDPKNHKYAGRYTQIVWQNTTRMGCAVSNYPDLSKYKSPYTNFLVVCYYSPAGNIAGKAPYSAGPPNDTLKCINKCECQKKYGSECGEVIEHDKNHRTLFGF